MTESTLDRRTFLAGTGALVAAAGLASATASSASSLAFADEAASGTYTAGTYTATATGIGTVTVTVTFDETSITEVVLDVSNETATIGQAAADTLIEQVLEAQSADIEGVSGATLTSTAVATGVADCIAQASAGASSEEEETEEEATEESTEEEETSSNGTRPDYPWDETAPEIADDEIEEELECDVVVVGAGIAGCAAIRAAAEEGASVIFFDKYTSTTSSGHQMAIVNGDVAAVWGRDGILDIDDVCDHEMDETSYFSKRAIYREWFNNMHEVFDWYLAVDPDIYICEDMYDVPTEGANSVCPMYCPLPELYDYTAERYPTYPSSATVSTDELNALEVEEAVNEYGAIGYYEHRVEQLIQDEDGRVTGVYAYNYSTGMYKKVTASMGVVLACGEYALNDEYVEYFLPEQIYNGNSRMAMYSDPDGLAVNQGDGLRMGDWAGARIQQHHALMIHHMGSSPLQCTPFLQLNKYGERFMNEDIPGQQIENQIELQKDFTSYLIFDANWAEAIPYMPAAHGVKCMYLDDDELDVIDGIVESEAFIYPSAVESAVENGQLATGDTLEELFAQLDIDAETAIASVERYNELCANGYDEDFGKTSSRLFAIETGPFYAETLTLASSLVCLGGLESDEHCHTFNQDRDIIPGLYVAGNTQGNRFSVQYPIAFCGIASSMALYYGYVAGKNVVSGE